MAGFDPARVPYCGSPPSPKSLWDRWNLDPVLLIALVAALALYELGASRLAKAGRCPPPWRRVAFVAGWLWGRQRSSHPLCPLSVSLFSARVGQHMILSLIAAPLVMLGRPELGRGRALARDLPMACGLSAGQGAQARAVGATLVFTLAIWFWHAPGPYDATFASPTRLLADAHHRFRLGADGLDGPA